MPPGFGGAIPGGDPRGPRGRGPPKNFGARVPPGPKGGPPPLGFGPPFKGQGGPCGSKKPFIWGGTASPPLLKRRPPVFFTPVFRKGNPGGKWGQGDPPGPPPSGGEPPPSPPKRGGGFPLRGYPLAPSFPQPPQNPYGENIV